MGAHKTRVKKAKAERAQVTRKSISCSFCQIVDIEGFAKNRLKAFFTRYSVIMGLSRNDAGDLSSSETGKYGMFLIFCVTLCLRPYMSSATSHEILKPPVLGGPTRCSRGYLLKRYQLGDRHRKGGRVRNSWYLHRHRRALCDGCV